jgi:hypothetical protein
MGTKFLTVAFMFSIVLFGTPSMINQVSAQTDTWYPGEGVTQDMYVKYRIEDYDTYNRQPYLFTLYFQERDQDGNWIVPAYVEADGTVMQGTMRLSETMSPIAGGEVPQEMRQFISGYQNSLIWLDAFTTQTAPQSLTAPNWGAIAAIGGEQIRPDGNEQISFAGAEDLCGAASCDTTVIMWRKGVDSRVWIANGFPFPVMAEAYADVTTPPQPIQYRFELLETGTGQPEAPTGTEEVASGPPVERTTNDGSRVVLSWDPVEILPNSTTSFGLEMYDARNSPLTNVAYDFIIEDANGQIIEEFRNQQAASGIGMHEVTFNSTGTMTITIQINSIEGMTLGTIVQTTDFNVVVVPEFPIGAAVVVATLVGVIIIMMRLGGSRLGSGIFSNKNFS